MPTRPPLHRPPGWHPTSRNPVAPDPYYQTKQHESWRAAVIQRDGYRCVAPDCETWARGAGGVLIADHIVERKRGGLDTLDNGRTLCPRCDNRRHREKGLHS